MTDTPITTMDGWHEVEGKGFDNGSFAEIVIDGTRYPAQSVARAFLAALSSPARSAEGMATVKPLTYDEVEAIILATEPSTLSDKGDQIWTRRMANALADLFNARLKCLSAQPGTEAEAGEPVAWIASADLERLPKDKPRSGLVQLASMDRCDPLGYCDIPLYAAPVSLASRVQELEKALRDIREKASQGMAHGLTADATCEDIRDIADATLTAKEA